MLKGWHMADVYKTADVLGESATAILLERPYKSYCSGSDQLVETGCWTNDGELTDLGLEVRNVLRLRAAHQ